MRYYSRNILLRGAVSLLLVLSTILCFGAQSVSDDFTERRITAGTKIFRAILAADAEVTEKKNLEGELLLCLVYENDWSNAKLSAETLQSRANTDIRGIKINPEFVSYTDLLSGNYKQCTGVFLAQQLSGKKLAELIEFARKESIVLFSPFEGDVERGVLGGIKVESQVLPYVNVRAVKKSNIKLKSFFMRVSKRYEE